MKNTVTVSISLPADVAAKLDFIALEMNISRSALCTAILSIVLKWDCFKETFNSIYGRDK